MTVQDIAAMTAIMGAIATFSTGYLKVFVGNKLGDMEDRILAKVESKFTRSDVSQQRFQDIERRLEYLEGRRSTTAS